MRTVKKWEMERGTGESVLEVPRRGKGMRRLYLLAGSLDDVDVFREGRDLLALSWNRRLGCVGLQVWGPEDNLEGDWDEEPQGSDDDVFLQSEDEIEAVLGPKGLDLAPITMAKRLYPWLHGA